LLAEPPPLLADFKIRISDGVTTKTVADGDDGSVDGLININTTLGNFKVVAVVGVSKPLVGNSSNAVMDITSLGVTSTGAGGTLTIAATDTGFKLPAGTAPVTSNIAGNLTAGGTVTYQSWIDLANNEFGGLDNNSGQVTTTGSQGPLSGLFTSTANANVPGYGGGDFSLTNELVITLPAGGAISSTDMSTSVVVPAPSSFAAVLFAMPVLGMYGWARKRKVVPV